MSALSITTLSIPGYEKVIEAIDSSTGLHALIAIHNTSLGPSFVINSGGIINASSEFLPGGYDPKVAQNKTANIYDTLLEIFKLAKETGKSTAFLANEMAMLKTLAKVLFVN